MYMHIYICICKCINISMRINNIHILYIFIYIFLIYINMVFVLRKFVNSTECSTPGANITCLKKRRLYTSRVSCYLQSSDVIFLLYSTLKSVMFLYYDLVNLLIYSHTRIYIFMCLCLYTISVSLYPYLSVYILYIYTYIYIYIDFVCLSKNVLH